MRDHAESVSLEEPGVLLLGHRLGESARTHRSQKVGHQILGEPSSLVAEVELFRIAQLVETVREKKMGRVVRVIAVHGSGRLTDADVNHARIAVEIGEIRAANSTV